MAIFSSKYGYKTDTVQLESVNDTLFNRVWGEFYHQEYTDQWGQMSNVERMMIEMGVEYQYPKNGILKDANVRNLRAFVRSQWYLLYDFVERYLSLIDKSYSKVMSERFNKILIEEVSGYRIINNEVVPITNEAELSVISQAKSTKYESVNTHISKALSFFSDRQKPDYENSVKESISAVEAICCIITGLEGKQATLGKALKKLKDEGVHIHPSLESAFSALYGYTSDEKGIRHGGIEFINIPSEDAKYMLVSCSAFVNYLIEKWSKTQSE